MALNVDELCCIVRSQLNGITVSGLKEAVQWCCAFASTCRGAREAVGLSVLEYAPQLIETVLFCLRYNYLKNSALLAVNLLAPYRESIKTVAMDTNSGPVPPGSNRRSSLLRSMIVELWMEALGKITHFAEDNCLPRAVLLTFGADAICGLALGKGMFRSLNIATKSRAYWAYDALQSCPCALMGQDVEDVFVVHELRRGVQLKIAHRMWLDLCSTEDVDRQDNLVAHYTSYVCAGSHWYFLEQTYYKYQESHAALIEKIMYYATFMRVSFFANVNVSNKFMMTLLERGRTCYTSILLLLQILLGYRNRVDRNCFTQIVNVATQICSQKNYTLSRVLLISSQFVNVFEQFHHVHGEVFPQVFAKTLLETYSLTAIGQHWDLDTKSKGTLVSVLGNDDCSMHLVRNVMLQEHERKHPQARIIVSCATKLVAANTFTDVLRLCCVLVKQTYKKKTHARARSLSHKLRTLISSKIYEIREGKQDLRILRQIALYYTLVNRPSRSELQFTRDVGI